MLERTRRFVVVEGVRQAKPLIEIPLGLRRRRGHGMVPVPESGEQRHGPGRRSLVAPVAGVVTLRSGPRGPRVAKEGTQLGGDALGALPVRRVPQIGIGDQTGPRNAAQQGVLLGAPHEIIPVTPDDEGARLDPVEPIRHVEGQDLVEHLSPEAPRQLPALLHHPPEERLGQGVHGCARLELAPKLPGHEVRKPLDGLRELTQRAEVTGRRRADEHETIDTLRVVDREALGDEAAHGMPDDRRTVDAEGVQQGYRVGREVLHPVAARGTLGVAVSPLRRNDRPYIGSEPLEDRRPRIPRIRVAVQQQHGPAVHRTGFRQGELDARSEPYARVASVGHPRHAIGHRGPVLLRARESPPGVRESPPEVPGSPRLKRDPRRDHRRNGRQTGQSTEHTSLLSWSSVGRRGPRGVRVRVPMPQNASSSLTPHARRRRTAVPHAGRGSAAARRPDSPMIVREPFGGAGRDRPRRRPPRVSPAGGARRRGCSEIRRRSRARSEHTKCPH